MPDIRFTIAGAMSLQHLDEVIRDESFGGRQLRLVTAMLLLERARPVRTDRLVAAVWPQGAPEHHQPALRTLVSRVRGLLVEVGLDRGAIRSGPGRYVVDIQDLGVDVEAATEAVGQARALAETGDHVAATRLAGEARSVLSRPVLPGIEAPWLDELRDRLTEHLIEVLLLLGSCRLQLGRTAAARTVAAEAVRLAPLREDAWRLAMRAEAAAGNTARALATYERLRSMLVEELGADPSTATQQLHRRLLEQLPRSGQDGRRAASSEVLAVHAPGRHAGNPYVGLQRFESDDAARFFGRSAETQELVERLRRQRAVVVVGASGTGKSSLVRAGLLPALRTGALPNADTWALAVMTPGTSPLDALDEAMARTPAGQPSLLVVDQAEELFTSCDDDDAVAFLDRVTDRADWLTEERRVVFVLRADFFDEAAGHPGLARVLSASPFVVPPLRGDGLELAITEPARRSGTRLEEGIVGRLVAETSTGASGLPLLQHVLWELWEHRDDDVMTLDALDRLGGVSGALARHAEEVWQRLPDNEQAIARRVLLRGVNPSPATPTATAVSKDELLGLGPRAAVDDVVAALVAARLLTASGMRPGDAQGSGHAVVEIAHEALLGSWPRLQAWIDDARDALRLHRSLAAAAAEWDANHRAHDYLLTGARLGAMESLDEQVVALQPVERDLLTASRAHEEQTRRRAEARRERERRLEHRARRRLQLAVAVLSVASLVTAGLTVWALDRDRRGDEATLAASTAEGMTRVAEVTSTAMTLLDSDPEQSLALGLHAVALSEAAGEPVPADTVAALHWGIQRVGATHAVAGQEARVIQGPSGPRGIFPTALPDLVRLASGATSGTLTTAECAALLGTSECPPLPSSVSDDLPWVEPPPIERPDGAPPLAGTTVTMLSPGFDRVLLQPETAAFRDASGIDVRVDVEFADWVFNSELAPDDVDIAILRAPAEAQQRGADGQLVDLSSYLDRSRLASDFSPYLVALGTGPTPSGPDEQGPVWGLPTVLYPKSLIWYPVPEFEEAGYEVPETWGDLVALSEQILADGRTPWCHAETLGATAGWPGTDWIEDLVLHDVGTDAYDGWSRGEVPFSDPRIRRAFERYTQLLLGPGRIHGGRETAVTADVREAQRPMFAAPPDCWLLHMPSFATDYHDNFGVQPGTDTAAFPMPPVAPQQTDLMLGGGDYIVAFRDRPEVRETIRWLTSPEYGDQLVAGDRGTSWLFFANNRFPLDAYTDPAERAVAARLQTALAQDRFRYDASDLMPEEVNAAFWDLMLGLLEDGPDELDSRLAEVDTAWRLTDGS